MVRETRRSACNRDCPDACGLLAEVEDGRLLSLKGDPDHPVTRGFLCFRTSRFPERLAGPDRLRGPLLRKDGRLQPVSLDEALDVAAEKLLQVRAESGPAAILHYRSGGSLGLLKLMADRFFEQFGPCAAKAGDICSGAGEAAQELDFGLSDSNDLFDLRNARQVLLWGKNPTVSAVHLVPVLKELRAAGGEVVLIDPVRTKAASLADRVLQPAPGRDLELALGVARLLFERGGLDPRAAERCEGLEELRALALQREVADWAVLADVEVAVVEDLARRLSDGPCAILVGWGMQRRSRGATTIRALDALAAISGNLFEAGGGSSFYFRRRGAFASGAISSGAAARRLREPMLGQDICEASDPPIRFIWITAGNPVCMLPDSARVAEALEQTEFVVVVDPFLTDTGRRADLVLPTACLLEDSDLMGSYGHHWLIESRPLIEPPPGVPQELELLQALAGRVGLEEVMAGSIDDWKRKLLAPVSDKGASLEELRQGAVRNPLAEERLFRDGKVATDSGKVRLLDALPEMVDDDPEGLRPLWLFSNSSARSQSSQWAVDPGDRLPVTVHPDAAPAGLVDGDPVWIESARARIRGRLQFDAAQRRDLALVPKGGSFDRGTSANALVAARATDLGLGAAFQDCRVRLLADDGGEA